MDALFRQQAECHRHEQPRKSKKHGEPSSLHGVTTSAADLDPELASHEQADTTRLPCAFWMRCTVVWQQQEPVQCLLLQHDTACLCQENR